MLRARFWPRFWILQRRRFWLWRVLPQHKLTCCSTSSESLWNARPGESCRPALLLSCVNTLETQGRYALFDDDSCSTTRRCIAVFHAMQLHSVLSFMQCSVLLSSMSYLQSAVQQRFCRALLSSSELVAGLWYTLLTKKNKPVRNTHFLERWM